GCQSVRENAAHARPRTADAGERGARVADKTSEPLRLRGPRSALELGAHRAAFVLQLEERELDAFRVKPVPAAGIREQAPDVRAAPRSQGVHDPGHTAGI